MDLDRQRQLELEAEAEMELENESRQSAPVVQPYQLGADYSQSLGSNAVKAIVDTPRAFGTMAEDAYNFAMPFDALSTGEESSGPIDTIARAGVEKTARTVGSLAAGTAGAAALAPFGAGWGTAFGPLGTVVGGVGAGALGFGAGLLGFDFATDATSGEIKSAGDYGKDLVYNTTQGVTTGLPMAAAAKLPALKNRVIAPFTTAGQEMRVVKELNRLEPGYANKIDAARAAGAGDPFLDGRSLGELLDSDVLKSTQRTLARTGNENYGRAAEANRVRNDTQLKYLNQIEQSALTPDDVQSSIRQNVAESEALSQRGLSAAEDAVLAAKSELPLPIDKIEAGGSIREGFEGGLNAQRGRVTAGFEGIGQGIVDPTPARAAAASKMPTYFKEVGTQPNPELIKLVESLSREAQPSALLGADGQPIVREIPYTIKDIQALRSQAIKIAKNSDARSGAVAGEIIKGLDESVDAAVKAGAVTPEEAASWGKGIEERKIQSQDFETQGTPAKAILARDPRSGSYIVPPETVPSKVFKQNNKGSRAALSNYRKATGFADEALDPVYRVAADSFRKFAVNEDGSVNSRNANKWLETHSDVLQDLPELKSKLGNVHSAQQLLNEKFGELKRSKADVEKSSLQFWLKDVEPDVAINQMLSGDGMVRKTVSTVQYLKGKDPKALAGLRRGIIENLKHKAFIPDEMGTLAESRLPEGQQFKGQVRGELLRAEWRRIRPALEKSKLYTDSQMKNFDLLYKDKSSQLSVEKAKMSGGSDTFQNSTTFAALSKIASNHFLSNWPTVKMIASVISPVLRAMPEGKFLQIMEEANLNPRYARDLQTKANAKNVMRTAEQIFKTEIDKALGNTNPASALVTGAGVAAPFAAAATSNQENNTPPPVKKPVIPKQNEITAKKSFPTVQELTRPPAQGSVRKTSFDVKGYIAQQSPETQARIGVESSGNPMAVSPKGAQGLSQLMPKTAQDIADDLGETYMPLRAGMTPEQQAFSIDQNVRFGDHYFNVMLPKINKAFKNQTLARAAYNAGPGRVTEAMAMAGSQTDVNKILASLPKGVQKETVPYVTEIMKRLG